MSVPAPHFLLYAEAAHAADPAAAGRWRFVLRLPTGETSLEAADEEAQAGPERLELLAVIRGLEALEAPSRVTLLSGSRQIRRGLQFGLAQWRENDWQWERYGRMTPVKNGDLWRRLDRLLEIHSLQCRPASLTKSDDLAPPPAPRPTAQRRTVRIDAAHSQSTASSANSPPRSAESPPLPRPPRRRFKTVRARPAPSAWCPANLLRFASRMLPAVLARFSRHKTFS